MADQHEKYEVVCTTNYEKALLMEAKITELLNIVDNGLGMICGVRAKYLMDFKEELFEERRLYDENLLNNRPPNYRKK